MERKITLTRKTFETDIELSLNLDGNGQCNVSTGVGFFDHMMTLFTKHGRFDLTLKATGDAADNHHVLEDIGPGPDELVLEFRYPHELGYEEEKVGTDACAALICANGHGPVPGQGVAAIMTHFVREIPGGIELRSRFWIGYGLVDGRLVKLVPDGVSVPEEVPMGLFAHNLKEFGHLAAILPQVYAENKDNW